MELQSNIIIDVIVAIVVFIIYFFSGDILQLLVNIISPGSKQNLQASVLLTDKELQDDQSFSKSEAYGRTIVNYQRMGESM